jgi:hypothetical protein
MVVETALGLFEEVVPHFWPVIDRYFSLLGSSSTEDE